MRVASILLMCLGILCTGCSDKEPPKKDTVKKAVAEKAIANESVTKLEIETPIYTSLLEISRDARHGNADKWKSKWIIFEGKVKSKKGEMISLHRPVFSETCLILENSSNPQFHEYSLDYTYIFSARFIRLSLNNDFVGISLRFENKGKLIIPPDYTGIIDVDLNVLANDVEQGGHEKWIGKRVRLIGKVRYKSEESNELHIVNPDYDIFKIFGFGNFEFVISGFDPNSNEIGEYKDDGVYTFTVKIEGLDPNLLILLRRYRLMTSIIDK